MTSDYHNGRKFHFGLLQKQTILCINENVTNNLDMQHKKMQGFKPMGFCTFWYYSYFHNWYNDQKLDNEIQMTLCWKYLDEKNEGIHSMALCNPCTVSYPYNWKSTYFNHKNNWMKLVRLTWIQSMYWWQKLISQNRNPRHNSPQTMGGTKYVCLVWIWTKENFLTHSRASWRTKECW